MTEHKVDAKGLWIKARISAAAEEVFNLVKDGVLTAFSVGFRIIDAEYNAAAEVFMVKELELHEISVVAVPANQNTLFSLSKSFDNEDEYKSFKMQFAPKSESAKGLESSTEADSTITKEWNMNPEEIQKMLAEAATKAAQEATKAIADQQAAEKALKAIAYKLGLRPVNDHSVSAAIRNIKNYVDIPEDFKEASQLSDYAVITRYPGDYKPVSPNEFKNALGMAEKIVNFAKGLL
jgi:HEPN domain-containing protein